MTFSNVFVMLCTNGSLSCSCSVMLLDTLNASMSDYCSFLCTELMCGECDLNDEERSHVCFLRQN